MNKWNIVRSVFGFTAVLISVLYTTTASAYIFGPPNVTELAEVGESANNLSLFSRTEADVFSGTNADVKSTGFSGVSKHGDQSGATTFMFRLASSNLSTPTLNRDGYDIGLGVGGEWNFLSDRSLGLIANFQFDISPWEYTKGSTNTGALYTVGGEVGGLYRIFLGTTTIAPFVLVNQFVTANQVIPTTGDPYTLTNAGNSTSYGLAVIVGKVTVSFTQTSSDSELTSSLNSLSTKKSTKGTMITLGFNF